MPVNGKETGKQVFEIHYPGGATLTGAVLDVLKASADALVCPVDPGLSLAGGLAAIVAQAAGRAFSEDAASLAAKIGHLEPTVALPISAGALPFKGAILACGPLKRDVKTVPKLEKTILNCLSLADRKGWRSVAFPHIGPGIFTLDHEMSAHAFKRALPEFWDATDVTVVTSVVLCLTLDAYPVYGKILSPGGNL